MKKIAITVLFICLVVCLILAGCDYVAPHTYTADDVLYSSTKNSALFGLPDGSNYYTYYKAYDEPAAVGLVTVDNVSGPLLISEIRSAVSFYRNDNKEIVSSDNSIEYNGVKYYYSAIKHFVNGAYSGKSKASLYYCSSTTIEAAVQEMLDIIDISRMSMTAVSSASELSQLANSNKTVKLTRDIDLSGSEWTPIEGFSGQLYGNGYKISGLTINGKNKSNLGLFATLTGRVENLSIENASITALGDAGTAGILAGVNKGVIENVTVSGQATFGYYSNIGGIAGRNDGGKILNCINKATISAANNVGGIAGYSLIAGSNVIDGNKNVGNITGQDNVGGIVGYAETPSAKKSEGIGEIVDCSNSGVIQGVNAVGGIFGKANGSKYTSGSYDWNKVTYCYYLKAIMLENTGSISGSISGEGVGGLIGVANNFQTLSISNNSADIEGGCYVGGLVGYGPSMNIIADKENVNTISGVAVVGGIAGRAGVVEDAVNSGTITASGVYTDGDIKGAYLGGVVGYCNGITNCVNKSDISYSFVGVYVGGVAGFISVTTDDIVNDNVNEGQVTAGDCVGGIAGYVTCPSYSSTNARNYSMGFNTNNGKVSGNASVGGIFGRMYAQYNVYYMSYYYNTFTISYCVNNAIVEGGEKVGGVVGSYYKLKTDDAVFATNTTTSGEVLGS